jgi:hypothetical protein
MVARQLSEPGFSGLPLLTMRPLPDILLIGILLPRILLFGALQLKGGTFSYDFKGLLSFGALFGIVLHQSFGGSSNVEKASGNSGAVFWLQYL